MRNIIINYEIFGALKIRLAKSQGSINVPKGTTIENFIVKIAGISKKYIKYMDITINGKKFPLDKKLKNKVKLKILLPIGGG